MPRWNQIVLVVLGLCLGFFLCEGLVRTLPAARSSPLRLAAAMESERAKFCQYDPRLGWDGKPSVDSSFQWVDSVSHVTQNTYGYRDPGFPFTRTSARRVLFLGDSFTWGFGVNNDELFTARLQEQAHADVVNLGVSGFGTDQELLLWQEKGWRWKPDVVFLVISIDTDFYDNLSPVRYDYPKPQFELAADGHLLLKNVPVPHQTVIPRSDAMDFHKHRLLRGAIRHSALLRLILERFPGMGPVRQWLASRWIIPQPPQPAPYEFDLFAIPYRGGYRNGWQLMSALIGALAKDVQLHGARLVLVAAPSRLQVYPTAMPLSSHLQNVTWDMDAPQREIAGIARQHSIAWVDLLPPLRNAARHQANLYFPYNLHWTPEGHRVVSNALASFLNSPGI